MSYIYNKISKIIFTMYKFIISITVCSFYLNVLEIRKKAFFYLILMFDASKINAYFNKSYIFKRNLNLLRV